jgi:heavy metal sensor kinase
MPSVRSFRVRITLLSVFLSGIVLLAFGTWSWSLIRRMSLERIDDQIRGIGLLHLSAHRPPEHWDVVGESLATIRFGDQQDTEPFILLVKNWRDDTLYLSPQWPAELPAAEYPAPSGQPPPMEPPPPAGYPPEGPRQMEPSPPDGNLPAGPPPDPRWGQPPGGRRQGPPMNPETGLPGQGFRPGEANERPFAGDLPDGRPPQREGSPRGPRFRGGIDMPAPRRLPVDPPRLVTREAGGKTWRMGIMGNPEVTMVLGADLDRYYQEMARVRMAFFLAFPSALLLIAVGGWILAHRALRPVSMLTRTAERITARGLNQRIPPSDDDAEFVRLIGVFNEMLDRLEKSFHQAVRFSADAAHELKTPLTILQGELEQSLQTAPAGSREQQTFNKLLEEVQRLKSIMRKLLLLSLADSGQLKLTLEPMDLSTTLESVFEDTQILAPHLTVDRDIAPGVRVNADRDLLRQVVQNLIGNAVKYNHKGGRIRFRLRENGPVVLLTIANTGKTVPPSERERIFDRFYRADPSRNRRIEGVGLGLSLAREIARAHHGNLTLDDTQDGIVSFTLTLPSMDTA